MKKEGIRKNDDRKNDKKHHLFTHRQANALPKIVELEDVAHDGRQQGQRVAVPPLFIRAGQGGGRAADEAVAAGGSL